MLTWDGQFVPVAGSDTFPIDTAIASHRYPQASSPTVVDSTGHRRILVVYESPSSNNGDILATAIDDTGTVLGHLNVNVAEVSPLRLSWPQRSPSVDCDGMRFAVAYHEAWNNSADLDTRLTLLSVSPGGAFHPIETGVALASGTDPEFNLQIASRYSSSGVASSRFGIANDHDGSGGFFIDAQAYDDLAAGSFTTRPIGCGGLLTIGHGGRAIPGATVSFSINSGNAQPGFLVGRAVQVPLAPLCPSCTLGVDGNVIMNNLLSFAIPADVGLIGLGFSVQGFMYNSFNPGGTACLGQIHLSDTIDVLIQ